jgi:hypothetical protein
MHTFAGPFNVVSIDLIFHKCKPQGKRRFQFPDFLKVRCLFACDSGKPSKLAMVWIQFADILKVRCLLLFGSG